MSSQFDASYAYTGPVAEEVQMAHRQEVERSMHMPEKSPTRSCMPITSFSAGHCLATGLYGDRR